MNEWVSTYQCQECRKLVQVSYKCTLNGHLAKAKRELEITEGNCRGCGEKLTENMVVYAGNRDFFERIISSLNELNFSLDALQGLKATVKEMSDFLASKLEWKEFIREKYAED